MAGSIQIQALSGYSGSLTTVSGGTQATGLQLTNGINFIGVVTAANDGVTLPATAIGVLGIVVRNNSATNALTVYPPVGGTINAQAANAGLSLAAATSAEFFPVSSTGLGFVSN